MITENKTNIDDDQYKLLSALKHEIIIIKGNLKDNYVTKTDIKNYVTKDTLNNYSVIGHKHDEYLVDDDLNQINILHTNLDNLDSDGENKIKSIILPSINTLRNSITNISSSLKGYITRSEFDNIEFGDFITLDSLKDFITKEDLNNSNNVLISNIDSLKKSITGISSSLSKYVTYNEFNKINFGDFITLDALKDFITKEDLNCYISKEESNNNDKVILSNINKLSKSINDISLSLSTFAKKEDINNVEFDRYVTKEESDNNDKVILSSINKLSKNISSLSSSLSDYITRDELLSEIKLDEYIKLDALKDYITKEESDNNDKVILSSLNKLSKSINDISFSLDNFVTNDEFEQKNTEFVKKDSLVDYVNKNDLTNISKNIQITLYNKVKSDFYTKSKTDELINEKISLLSNDVANKYVTVSNFDDFKKYVDNVYLEKEDFIYLNGIKYNIIHDNIYKSMDDFLSNVDKLSDGIYIIGDSINIVTDGNIYPISYSGEYEGMYTLKWKITNDY